MESVFVFLYPLLTINTIIAYLPQIVQLIKAEKASDDISLTSWYLWLGGGVIALGYGLFHLQDFMFCLTTALNLLFMGAVVGLILYNRHIRFAEPVLQPVRVKSTSSRLS